MDTSKYQEVLDYIDQFWLDAAFAPRQRQRGGFRNIALQVGDISLPHAAISPCPDYFGGTSFYWDNYFTILGLVQDGHAAEARGIVDNQCYLFDIFGLMPARNSRTSRGRTQPPFMTRMAWEVYEAGVVDDAWMKHVMAVAAKEYETAWHNQDRYVSVVGLNRYKPKHLAKLFTMYESGWDQSTRFSGFGADLIPADLNAQLYQYEADQASWADMYDPDQAIVWKERMEKRLALFDQYCWDDQTGFYYDYDLRSRTQRPLKTLAGFYALWAGMASAEQAERCVRQMPVFEHDYGLADTEPIPWHGKQWDYPNGWPSLQYVVISGLRRYGYNEEAARLTRKWLDLNLGVFDKTGKLWEKYDVVRGKIGLPGRYPTQAGFGWTCGVFIRLLNDLEGR